MRRATVHLAGRAKRMERHTLDLAAIAADDTIAADYAECIRQAGAALRRGSSDIEAGRRTATVTLTVVITHDGGKERTKAEIKCAVRLPPADAVSLDLALPYGSDEVLLEGGNARQMRLGAEADDVASADGLAGITMTGVARSVSVTGDQAAKALRKLAGGGA